MAWMCKDCGEELRINFNPLSVSGDWELDDRFEPVSPTAFHLACSDETEFERGLAVWIPAPKPGVVEALESLLRATSSLRVDLQHTVYCQAGPDKDAAACSCGVTHLLQAIEAAKEAERCGK